MMRVKAPLQSEQRVSETGRNMARRTSPEAELMELDHTRFADAKSALRDPTDAPASTVEIPWISDSRRPRSSRRGQARERSPTRETVSSPVELERPDSWFGMIAELA